MRVIAILCGTVVALLHAAIQAQTQTEYELAHQLAETNRQVVVAANLPLIDSEAERFWDMYREYRAKSKEMDDMRVALFERFEKDINDLPADVGGSLVTDALRVEGKRQALKKRYFKKLAHVLPGQRLFRYYQIETKLDAKVRHQWTGFIPLVPVTE